MLSAALVMKEKVRVMKEGVREMSSGVRSMLAVLCIATAVRLDLGNAWEF
jgi:hypothetical protein